MGLIQQIKDSLGNLIYPVTKTKAVYDDENNRLDNTLDGINSSLANLNSSLTSTKQDVTALNNSLSDLNRNLIPSTNALFTTQPSDYFEIQYLTSVKIGNLIIASLTIHILSNMAAWTEYTIATANNTSIINAGCGFLVSQNTNNAYTLTGGRGYDINIRTDIYPPQNGDWLRGMILYYQS